jgi:hypothetical protein
LVIGAIAAMALPPQMAVPAEMRYEIRCLTLKNRPNPQPKSRAMLMLPAVGTAIVLIDDSLWVTVIISRI